MLRRILRYVYRQLLPADMRQALDLCRYLRMEEALGEVTAQRILVLSPHPDDDVIGCGGTLHHCHLKGADITSVYLTDGRTGSRTYTAAELVPMRRNEAQRAAAIIGIDRLIFLDIPDLQLAPIPHTMQQLTTVFQDVQPTAVFLPFFMDPHHHHMATNRIFLAILDRLPEVMCYAFGLWRPLATFNYAVDITPYVEVKTAAIQAHQSQVRECDFVNAFLGLSKYYAIITGQWDGTGWKEVFIRCPSREYKRLAEAVAW